MKYWRDIMMKKLIWAILPFYAKECSILSSFARTCKFYGQSGCEIIKILEFLHNTMSLEYHVHFRGSSKHPYAKRAVNEHVGWSGRPLKEPWWSVKRICSIRVGSGPIQIWLYVLVQTGLLIVIIHSALPKVGNLSYSDDLPVWIRLYQYTINTLNVCRSCYK